MMDGQMTIFDFLPAPNISLEDMSDEEMISTLESATGLSFSKIEWRWDDKVQYEYEAKKGNVKYTASFSRYLTDNRDRIIMVGYERKKNYEGGGAPCESLEEAVNWLKRQMRRLT